MFTRSFSEMFSVFSSETPSDLQLLKILKTYPNGAIQDKAVVAFSRHVWSLAEDMVGLFSFDDGLDAKIKAAIITKLSDPSLENRQHRTALKNGEALFHLVEAD